MQTTTKIIASSFLLLPLVACKYDSGDRTERVSQGKAVIERSIAHVHAPKPVPPGSLKIKNPTDSNQLVGCVSQPSDWPLPTVAASGTYNDGDAFSATPVSYSGPLFVLNQFHEREGYTWHCYTDEAREYSQADYGTATFTLSPTSDDAVVLTMLSVDRGSEDGQPITLFYAEQVASHYIKTDTSTSDYLRNLDEANATVSSSLSDVVKGELKHFVKDGTAYFYSDQEKLHTTDFKLKGSTSDFPETDTLTYLNGQFISLNDGFTESSAASAGGTSTTFVSVSDDLVTWSDATAVGFRIDHNLTYDSDNDLYISRNFTDSSQLISTADFLNWDENDVPTDANDYRISDNGNGLARYNSKNNQVIRKLSGGDWQEVAVTPAAEGDFKFIAIAERNNRFYLVAKQNVQEDADFYYGYSDNLTAWTWHSVALEDSLISHATLAPYTDNIIAISASDDLFITENNGAEWRKAESLLAQKGITSIDDGAIESFQAPSYSNGMFYGKVNKDFFRFASRTLVNMGVYHYSTTDFKSYKLWAVSNSGRFVLMPDKAFYYDVGNQFRGNIYEYMTTETAPTPAPENGGEGDSNDDDKDNNSGGSLFYLLAAFALMIRIRRMN